MQGRRVASFVVYGKEQEIDLAEVTSRLGEGEEDQGALSQGDTVWVLGDLTLSPRSFDELLEELWDAVSDVRQIQETAGLGSLLRLAQYTSAADRVGPGIVIPTNWVQLLARFNGSVDIDQYVSDTQDFASNA